MLRIHTSVLGSIALLLALSLSPRAYAVDSFFDIFIDAGECRYRSLASTSSTLFPPGPPGTVETEMLSMSLSHTDPLNETVTDLGGGQFRIDSFFDIFYEIGPPSGNFQVDSFFDVHVEIEFTPDPSGQAGSWDTEILSMDLSGTSPDPGNQTQLRLAPGLEHRGHVTILKISDPGDPDSFQIDSFFDIHYEISSDGGNTWQAASSSTPLSESEIYTVPEPGSLALLGLAGLVALRRRSRD